jgi:hypothetical protein
VYCTQFVAGVGPQGKLHDTTAKHIHQVLDANNNNNTNKNM